METATPIKINEPTALYFLSNHKHSKTLKWFGQQPTHNYPQLAL